MSDFKSRLQNELEDLAEKIYKLKNFLKNVNKDTFDKNQLSLLEIQVSTMESYARILDARLTLLKDFNPDAQR